MCSLVPTPLSPQPSKAPWLPPESRATWQPSIKGMDLVKAGHKNDSKNYLTGQISKASIPVCL